MRATDRGREDQSDGILTAYLLIGWVYAVCMYVCMYV